MYVYVYMCVCMYYVYVCVIGSVCVLSHNLQENDMPTNLLLNIIDDNLFVCFLSGKTLRVHLRR